MQNKSDAGPVRVVCSVHSGVGKVNVDALMMEGTVNLPLTV